MSKASQVSAFLTKVGRRRAQQALRQWSGCTCDAGGSAGCTVHDAAAWPPKRIAAMKKFATQLITTGLKIQWAMEDLTRGERAMPRRRDLENARRKGERARRAVETGGNNRSNPFDSATSPDRHKAWADGYARWDRDKGLTANVSRASLDE